MDVAAVYLQVIRNVVDGVRVSLFLFFSSRHFSLGIRLKSVKSR